MSKAVGIDSDDSTASDIDVITATSYSEKENVVVMPKWIPGPYLSGARRDNMSEPSVVKSCVGNVGLNIVVDYTEASIDVTV